MIEVELHRSGDAEAGYRKVATLRVENDGTWSITGDQTALDLSMPTPLRRDGIVHRLTLQDHPATWARLLPRRLRSGYLAAVIAHDDGKPPNEIEPPMLTRAAAAKLAGVTADTWSAYVTRGQAPAPAKRIGRTPLWDLTHVQQWLTTRPRARSRSIQNARESEDRNE